MSGSTAWHSFSSNCSSLFLHTPAKPHCPAPSHPWLLRRWPSTLLRLGPLHFPLLFISPGNFLFMWGLFPVPPTTHIRARRSWLGLALLWIVAEATVISERAAVKQRNQSDLRNLNYSLYFIEKKLMCLKLFWNFLSTASENPWGQCPVNRKCKDKFGDGACDRECMAPGCLRDGLDCLKERGPCK